MHLEIQNESIGFPNGNWVEGPPTQFSATSLAFSLPITAKVNLCSVRNIVEPWLG